jgi:hypothetical protein
MQPPLIYSYPAPITPIGAPPSSPTYAPIQAPIVASPVVSLEAPHFVESHHTREKPLLIPYPT